MKINAKSFRKAMSLVLTFAILMSVCAVMLTTFASATTTIAQTYVYNFRKDSDGTNNYVEGVNYLKEDNDTTSTKHSFTDFRVTNEGLRIDVNGTEDTTFGANVQVPGFFLSDPDVTVGDANGLKFEAGKDYGIVLKYKVLNETAAKAAAEAAGISANYRLNLTMLVTNEGTIGGTCASTLAVKGSQPSDVFSGYNQWTQTQIVCETSTGASDYVDGEWHYYTIALDGDKAYGRTALTDSSNQYLKIFVAGTGAQFLIESATVTVMDCANDHFESQGAPQTTEFKKITVKDDSATPNKVAAIRYMLPGDSLQGLVSGVDKTKEAYNTTTGNNNVVVPSSDTVYNLSSFRTKTEKFVYDFTSATVAAAYEGGTHADHLSNNGNSTTPSASQADDGVALPSKVVATGNTDTTYTEPGLWFTSTANGSSTTYASMHKAFLYGCADANAFTRTTTNYSNALIVSSNKNYRVEVVYKYVKDSQRWLTNTMNDVVLAVSSAVDGAESGSTFLIVDTSAIDTADKTNYHTAVFEFDSDATPVSGYTLHGGRLCIGTNGGASIIINKVTVYVADKDTTAGAEVFATVDGAEKKLVSGQTLVTSETKSGVASTGWFDESGARQYTAKAQHYANYYARYDSGLSVYEDFTDGVGGYYLPRTYANQTYEIVDSGYADHGKALKFTGSSNASNSSANFVLTTQNGTTETPYKIEAGKKYSISFDFKVLQANTDSTTAFHMLMYLVDDGGINASGHKTQAGATTGGTLSVANYNLGNAVANVKANASSSDWLSYNFTFTAPETLTTCTTDSLVQNIPALHFVYGANNGASTVTAEVMIDNIKFSDTTDPYGNVADGVKSSIRAEVKENGSYTTAGIRFRTRIAQSDIWATTNAETGFVAIPEALIATAEQAMGGKWYDMSKTSALREVAITSQRDKSGVQYTVYDSAPESGKYDVQLLVKGLTQEGSTKNLKSNNIAVVFYIKKVDAETEAVSYTYRFVKSASYNEVKQMYVDAGVTGANAY